MTVRGVWYADTTAPNLEGWAKADAAPVTRLWGDAGQSQTPACLDRSTAS